MRLSGNLDRLLLHSAAVDPKFRFGLMGLRAENSRTLGLKI